MYILDTGTVTTFLVHEFDRQSEIIHVCAANKTIKGNPLFSSFQLLREHFTLYESDFETLKEHCRVYYMYNET